jgi:hypothetical protein
MGEVILTITAHHGVTRIQLKATSPAEEERSLQLYHRLKPIIDAINRHAQPGGNVTPVDPIQQRTSEGGTGIYPPDWEPGRSGVGDK